MEYATLWNNTLVEPKHPALHNPADIDPLETDIVWQTVEQEMFQLMRDRMGLGLAAPQLGNTVKMFVMSHSTLGNTAVYNPEIMFQSEETTSLHFAAHYSYFFDDYVEVFCEQLALDFLFFENQF